MAPTYRNGKVLEAVERNGGLWSSQLARMCWR
jgi:hypothetical protein